MKTKEQLIEDLSQFCGTTRYHGHSRFLVLTDGAKYLCENAEMFWFADVVSSVLTFRKNVREEGFLVAKLLKVDEGWRFEMNDGNDGVLYTQDIEYSDCPLDEVEVFVEESGQGYKVMLLPSEH